jgi:hypothetical protein
MERDGSGDRHRRRHPALPAPMFTLRKPRETRMSPARGAATPPRTPRTARHSMPVPSAAAQLDKGRSERRFRAPVSAMQACCGPLFGARQPRVNLLDSLSRRTPVWCCQKTLDGGGLRRSDAPHRALPASARRRRATWRSPGAWRASSSHFVQCPADRASIADRTWPHPLRS